MKEEEWGYNKQQKEVIRKVTMVGEMDAKSVQGG